MSLSPLFAWMPGPLEWLVIGGVALLLFGKRLPEVARSMGKGIVEFKKGLKDVEDDVKTAGREEKRDLPPPPPPPAPPSRD